jgi:hypothetical protein
MRSLTQIMISHIRYEMLMQLNSLYTYEQNEKSTGSNNLLPSQTVLNLHQWQKPSAFPWVVRASVVTPRKPQISKVIKPHSEIRSKAKEFYFSRSQNTLTALTSELNTKTLQLTLGKAVSHTEKLSL